MLVLVVVQADGRLFAIGEDAGLAALRSAGKALAEAGKHGKRSRVRQFVDFQIWGPHDMDLLKVRIRYPSVFKACTKRTEPFRVFD